MTSNQLTVTLVVALAILLLSGGQVVKAELSTLFTTPQEREVIDSNRYKSADNRAPQQVEEKPIEASIPQAYREEVIQQYRISGITISRDGPHTVWINSIAYEDGELLEDNSKIKVIVGDEIRVRITTPDGKNHYATSGETLAVSYLARAGN